MGDGDQGDVVVPAGVGATLEVVEAKGVLQLAVVLLDPPAQLGEADQFLDWRLGGEVGEPEIGGPLRPRSVSSADSD